MKPILKITKANEYGSGETYRCPKCDSHVYPMYSKNKLIEIKYCEMCGTQIDWKFLNINKQVTLWESERE